LPAATSGRRLGDAMHPPTCTHRGLLPAEGDDDELLDDVVTPGA
jgi:hypothetical protein